MKNEDIRDWNPVIEKFIIAAKKWNDVGAEVQWTYCGIGFLKYLVDGDIDKCNAIIKTLEMSTQNKIDAPIPKDTDTDITV